MILAAVLVAYAAFTDWRTQRISPFLCGLGAVVGFATLGWSGLLGCIVCLVGPVVLCLRGQIGGGDVKVLGAVGALLGWRLGLCIELVSVALILISTPRIQKPYGPYLLGAFTIVSLLDISA